MSVQNIQTSIQSNEQYKIRKQTEAQQAEELQEQLQQAEQTAQEIRQVDVYDKENPVGEEVEGIYSVSHDESGNLKIDYKQPTSKSKDTGEKSSTMTVKANEKSGEAKGGAAPAAASNTEESSDSEDDEEELEKLKQQRDAIKQQLNRAADEDTKAALRAQLQAIEVQIALKSSGTD